MAQKQLWLWLTSAFLVSLLAAIQVPLHYWDNATPKLQHMLYLPSGEYLRMASLGYRELVADVLWLETIQVMGERKLSDEQGQWLYRAFDIITTIDPKFVRVYEAGGLALCSLVVLPEESNRLLEKGMRHNPEEWKLPFIMGINYYFELSDDTKAAESMALASRLPGAPDYTARLAAKLYVNAKNPQLGIDLLMEAYESTTDQNVRQALEVRLKETILERDLDMLERAIAQYRTMHQRLPRSMNELVGQGLLSALPTEPFGGHYVYDASTGKVWSSEVKDRMRITTRRRGQYSPN
jgi:hypothetical protein